MIVDFFVKNCIMFTSTDETEINTMATRLVTGSEYFKIVKAAVNTGKWCIETKGKHNKLKHIESGKLVFFPITPGDCKGHLNLKKNIKRIEAGLPGWGERKDQDCNPH